MTKQRRRGIIWWFRGRGLEGRSFNRIIIGIVVLRRSFGWNSNSSTKTSEAMRLCERFQRWGFQRVCAEKRGSRERRRHSQFRASESDMNLESGIYGNAKRSITISSIFILFLNSTVVSIYGQK